jgi:hypothetical protein
LGERVDDETFFALELLNDMFTYYQIREGKKDSESLLIELKSGQNVIFPLEGDRKVIIASLGIILNKLNSEDNGTRIGSDDVGLEDCQRGCLIDLRFKNPVIKP